MGHVAHPQATVVPALTKNLSDLNNDYTYFTSHVLGSRSNGGGCRLFQ